MPVAARPSSSDFSWTDGWTAPGRAGAAQVRKRFGSPQQKTMDDWLAGPPNPNLSVPSAENPALADQVQRNLNSAVATEAGNIRSANSMLTNPGATHVTTGQVEGADVPAAGFDVGSAGDVTPDANDLRNPHSGSQVAMKTPEELQADAQGLWLGRGGSLATLHRAQVAGGIRPPIDARTTMSAADRGGSPSEAIQRGWGWQPTSFGNAGSALWAEMTDKFNKTRAALQNSLGVTGASAPISDNPTPVGPMDTGDQYT